MANWTVKDALYAVTTKIEEGVKADGGMETSAEIKAELALRYQTDFQVQHTNDASWDDAQKRILPLATVVGKIAAILTKAKAPDAKSVDPDCAIGAAYIVSKVACRQREEADGREERGEWCKRFPL